MMTDYNNSTDLTMQTADAFAALERGVYAALETYSNVHRGSGHYSMVSTELFEQAREIVLEYLGLNNRSHVVIFSTPAGAADLTATMEPGSFHLLSSADFGLPLGVRALAVRRSLLPKGTPSHAGGGTARLISRDWILWASPPDRFEAGTPAIINVIAFARALRLAQQSGNNIFTGLDSEKLSAKEILYHDELVQYTGHELLEKLRQSMIGRGLPVPTTLGLQPFINFDHSASTPSFASVWKTVCQVWQQPATVQQEVVREARSICAKALGAPPATYDVIFTSNTTDAINLVAKSMDRETAGEFAPVVLNTLLEHSSNDLPWRINPRISLVKIHADAEGFIDLTELESQLQAYNEQSLHGNKRIRLVTLSGASNVLGSCNNLPEISRIVHQYGARLLVDAAQLVAHRMVEMEKWGIDYLAFSAHKFYAPFGSGALVARKGLLAYNSEEMEIIRASGEENTTGIAALGKALVLLQRVGMEVIREEELVLTKRLLRGLQQVDGLTIYGMQDPGSPAFTRKVGVVVFSLQKMMSNGVATELALRGGIGVRYGCHCAHILIKHLLGIGPWLEQFQKMIVTVFPKTRLPGVARVSLGIGNSEEEIQKLIRVLGEISGKPLPPENPRPGSANERNTRLPKSEVKKQIALFTKEAAHRVYSI